MPSLEQLLRKREGCEYVVYLDSMRKPTVGIGHLVTSADKLKLGDKIDDNQVSAFFKEDSAKALAAARAQAAKAGIKDPAFIVYLASVNFQLGIGWRKKFKKTWALIMDGKYSAAAEEVQKSRWYSQTPIRAKDFQRALLSLDDAPDEKDGKK
jgi:GH24 family phage-related lysozyme (muramidase)